MIRKQLDAVVKANSHGNISATISTSEIDRDREVVLAKGMKIDRFMENRVILWAHDHKRLPIGRATALGLYDDRWVAHIEPSPTDLGTKVFELIEKDFLSAVSIGFDPGDDYGPPTRAEIKARPELARAGTVFRDAELLEFSIVNVGSNANALIHRQKGSRMDRFIKLPESAAQEMVSAGTATWALSEELPKADNEEKTLQFIQTETLPDEIALWMKACLADPDGWDTSDADPTDQRVKQIIKDEIRHRAGRMVEVTSHSH